MCGLFKVLSKNCFGVKKPRTPYQVSLKNVTPKCKSRHVTVQLNLLDNNRKYEKALVGRTHKACFSIECSCSH